MLDGGLVCLFAPFACFVVLSFPSSIAFNRRIFQAGDDEPARAPLLIERSITISNDSFDRARRSAKLKQTERAAFILRFPEGLQVRVLRVENILDDHRQAGKTENHSGS